jgi:MSHA pilin protein MshC
MALGTKHIARPASPISAQHGFTLVELMTVVILLSIVAIVAVPRFTGSSGYTEYAMQKRLLGALRSIQLKAIYDTRPEFCYKLVIDTSTSPEFGPSTASYLTGNDAVSCANAIDYSAAEFTRSDLGEIANDGLTFSAFDAGIQINYIQFDNIGRASTDAGACAANCMFSFSGERSASVCVASEGYIYAC